jgi:hypothetical protein
MEHHGAVRLDVPVEDQLLENWCWAAISSALGRYYGTSDESQATIATQVLKRNCVGFALDDEIRRNADTTSRLDTAMRFAGCYSHWSPGKPLFDRVRFEINLGRPFGARIGWHAGAAHYVLIHGYRDDGERLLVADPLHGSGEYPLGEFPARYRQGGAWTETFWTTPAASVRSETSRSNKRKVTVS